MSRCCRSALLEFTLDESGIFPVHCLGLGLPGWSYLLVAYQVSVANEGDGEKQYFPCNISFPTHRGGIGIISIGNLSSALSGIAPSRLHGWPHLLVAYQVSVANERDGGKRYFPCNILYPTHRDGIGIISRCCRSAILEFTLDECGIFSLHSQGSCLSGWSYLLVALQESVANEEEGGERADLGKGRKGSSIDSKSLRQSLLQSSYRWASRQEKFEGPPDFHLKPPGNGSYFTKFSHN